jgi:hypothetical protein
MHGLRSGGCADSNAEREFPSDKVYRRDDHGIVGVESFSPHSLGFFIVHTVLDVPTWCSRALIYPYQWIHEPNN